MTEIFADLLQNKSSIRKDVVGVLLAAGPPENHRSAEKKEGARKAPSGKNRRRFRRRVD
jgi:hypothetical protein